MDTFQLQPKLKNEWHIANFFKNNHKKVFVTASMTDNRRWHPSNVSLKHRLKNFNIH